MSAAMMRRGSGGIPFLELSGDLESRSINIEVSDAGDTTHLSGSCGAEQLDYAIERANLILTKPDFPADEFRKLKQQTVGGLMQSLAQPSVVAQRDYAHALYEGGPQGRVATPQTLVSITLDDVKKWYETVYKPAGAFLVFSGDITPEQGKALAAKLLQGFDRSGEPPKADYAMKPAPEKRRILLIDNPEGKQATVRLGLRAYDIHADDKYPGSVAGQILSAGIESRLNKYVRAEKGLTYGCYAYFRPGRHAGEFSGSVDTNPETTAAAVEAMFKVFNDLRTTDVTPVELAEAKSRVAGGMVMEMQTISQQAGRRAETILNDYSIDYYDVYPQKIAQVTADQVREVMKHYVDDGRMLVVVVAPADAVKAQLDKLGDVQVLPMPAKRPDMALPGAPGGGGGQELLQPKQSKDSKDAKEPEPKKKAA
jgi:zinc protease